MSDDDALLALVRQEPTPIPEALTRLATAVRRQLAERLGVDPLDPPATAEGWLWREPAFGYRHRDYIDRNRPGKHQPIEISVMAYTSSVKIIISSYPSADIRSWSREAFEVDPEDLGTAVAQAVALADELKTTL